MPRRPSASGGDACPGFCAAEDRRRMPPSVQHQARILRGSRVRKQGVAIRPAPGLRAIMLHAMPALRGMH